MAMPSRASARAANAGRLACFRPAELEYVPARRRVAEVVIEGDDAMELGPRAVERSGDERLGGLVDVAEFVLQGLQNGQQRAVHLAVLRNDFACAIRTPCLVLHGGNRSRIGPSRNW
jgi:hypothetical protein